MARATLEVIRYLLNTACRLESSNDYQWGHMGSCNCGFLAQEVTKLSRTEIHRRALSGDGDWNEQLNDYCPTSGFLFDDVITQLLLSGFDSDDLKQLETLSSPEILATLPNKTLCRNNKADVIVYLRAWAAILEDRLLGTVQLPSLQFVSVSPNLSAPRALAGLAPN